ncbi:hypothetical protein DFH09DRAFT_1279481 [Mycena vulgaris]|nr:hypothetical protein DFH09DRAFT_1279481 [Mycena vulgaris]
MPVCRDQITQFGFKLREGLEAGFDERARAVPEAFRAGSGEQLAESHVRASARERRSYIDIADSESEPCVPPPRSVARARKATRGWKGVDFSTPRGPLLRGILVLRKAAAQSGEARVDLCAELLGDFVPRRARGARAVSVLRETHGRVQLQSGPGDNVHTQFYGLLKDDDPPWSGRAPPMHRQCIALHRVGFSVGVAGGVTGGDTALEVGQSSVSALDARAACAFKLGSNWFGKKKSWGTATRRSVPPETNKPTPITLNSSSNGSKAVGSTAASASENLRHHL